MTKGVEQNSQQPNCSGELQASLFSLKSRVCAIKLSSLYIHIIQMQWFCGWQNRTVCSIKLRLTYTSFARDSNNWYFSKRKKPQTQTQTT